MKIKSLIIFAVLATAFLSFSGVAKASCLEENFTQKTDAEKIQCLTSVIADLTRQIAQIQGQQRTTTSSSWCHDFNAYLKAGDSGNEVSELNNALSHDFYGEQDHTDYRNFDDQMASWVVRFQAKYGITQTGTVGPVTRAKLNRLFGCAVASESRLMNESLTQPAVTIFTPSHMSSGWLPIAGDWNGNGTDTVGLYDPTTSIFHLRNSNSAGNADITFPFGALNAGWIPIAGDWDGNGTDTVGLYDPATSQFYLKNTNSTGTGNADISFAFGTAGANWIPIAGDWNHDGIDTVGLYDASSSHFYLRNSNSTGMSDINFGYGVINTAWPVAGDWNGDGYDTVGLYNPATAIFSLRNSNTVGTADITFAFGSLNNKWLPISGDWDYDASHPFDAIGLYDPASSHFYLRNTNTSGNSDTSFGFGVATVVTPAQPSITVTSPNGGESWQIGTTHNITWTSTGVNNVMIELDKNSPNTGWHLTYSVPASAGSFAWIVPSTGSNLPVAANDYKIKIWDTTNSSITDSSNNYFSIAAPIVTPVTCTSFTYSAWSTCINGNQTRAITSMTPTGCTGGTPEVLSQSCTAVPNSTWLPISGKWMAGATKDTIGLYDPVSSQFYLRTTNTTGVSDISFGFGTPNAGWLPIVGDWNHDGIDTVGLYDPTTSIFHLRNSNSSGNADITFGFGAPNAGWLPIAGDWNGDGVSTVGLYDPASSHFYLRNTNTAGNSDISFGFGAPGWKPVSGSWAGDGADAVGLYDPVASQFYLRNTNTAGMADISFGFGAPGWKPVMGDWDENGTSTAGLFNSSTSTFYLRNTNTTGNADITARYGALTSAIPQNSIASASDAFYKILEELKKLLLK